MREYKYGPGDIVRVRNDLVVGEMYEGEHDTADSFVEDMERFKGQCVTISCINVSNKYEVDEDDGAYSWTTDMFEGLACSPCEEGKGEASDSEEISPPEEKSSDQVDCSEAEDDLADGYFACVYSDNEPFIVGDVIHVERGSFRFRGVLFHHVFYASSIGYGLKRRFGVEAHFVKLREAR